MKLVETFPYNLIKSQNLYFFASLLHNPNIQRMFNIYFIYFSVPPDISVEKSWIHSGEGFEAVLVCIVHADPSPTVRFVCYFIIYCQACRNCVSKMSFICTSLLLIWNIWMWIWRQLEAHNVKLFVTLNIIK